MAAQAIRKNCTNNREAATYTINAMLKMLPRELDYIIKDEISVGTRLANEIDLTSLRLSAAKRISALVVHPDTAADMIGVFDCFKELLETFEFPRVTLDVDGFVGELLGTRATDQAEAHMKAGQAQKRAEEKATAAADAKFATERESLLKDLKAASDLALSRVPVTVGPLPMEPSGGDTMQESMQDESMGHESQGQTGTSVSHESQASDSQLGSPSGCGSQRPPKRKSAAAPPCVLSVVQPPRAKALRTAVQGLVDAKTAPKADDNAAADTSAGVTASLMAALQWQLASAAATAFFADAADQFQDKVVQDEHGNISAVKELAAKELVIPLVGKLVPSSTSRFRFTLPGSSADDGMLSQCVIDGTHFVNTAFPSLWLVPRGSQDCGEAANAILEFIDAPTALVSLAGNSAVAWHSGKFQLPCIVNTVALKQGDMLSIKDPLAWAAKPKSQARPGQQKQSVVDGLPVPSSLHALFDAQAAQASGGQQEPASNGSSNIDPDMQISAASASDGAQESGAQQEPAASNDATNIHPDMQISAASAAGDKEQEAADCEQRTKESIATAAAEKMQSEAPSARIRLYSTCSVRAQCSQHDAMHTYIMPCMHRTHSALTRPLYVCTHTHTHTHAHTHLVTSSYTLMSSGGRCGSEGKHRATTANECGPDSW